MSLPAASQHVRSINYAALNEVLLLGGTAALLWIKWTRGQLSFYVHPRYTMLILVSAIILLLMAGIRLRGIFAEQRSPGAGWMYILLALPLLLGTIVPVQPLGAGTLAERGLEPASVALVSNQQGMPSGDTSSWDLLDWAMALSMQGDADLQGEAIDVLGFVFQDERLGQDHFYVARYVITCCAADGMSIGLPVIWPNGQALPSDSWVHVQGTLASTTGIGGDQPAIMATAVEPASQPEVPYLFP